MANKPTPESSSGTLPAVSQEMQGLSRSTKSDLIGALADVSLSKIEHLRDELRNYITSPYDQKTPKEKVKKRPDGYDYIESSFMDFEAKKFMPLYKFKLIHISWEFGFINCIVSLTDRITGNTELGGGSARIQVSKGVVEPGFRDVIDMGNNLKAALTNAIKNAQSRFGIAADIYQRRESIPTDAERDRFASMEKQIYEISATRARQFAEQWTNLGTDWSEFLDKWQVYVDRHIESKENEK